MRTRNSIAQAAIDVFSTKGYKQTTIKEVARRAGVSVGCIYRYFKNKQELYLGLVSQQVSHFEEGIEQGVVYL